MINSRLAVLVYAVAAVQALFFATLAPLLPSFGGELGLSKADAGLLVGMFPIGQGFAAVPVGLLVSRVGVKPFAIGGLAILSITSLAFGVVDDYNGLLATRFLQGVGAALCWSSGLAWLMEASPRGRRGETIGIFVGAGAAGQVIGPAVGGLAEVGGRVVVFVVLAALTATLAIVITHHPGPPVAERQSFPQILRAHGSRVVLGGLTLVVVPGLLLGTIFVLGPLRLSHLGWGPTGIAVTFLAAAAVGALARPLTGRWADRHGPVAAIQAVLLAAIPLTLVIPWIGNRWLLSLSVVLAVSTYGCLWGPPIALLSHAYDDAGVVRVSGFALIGLTTGIAFFVGSGIGGELAHLAGDAVAYALPAAACAVTLLVLRRGSRTVLAQPALAADLAPEQGPG